MSKRLVPGLIYAALSTAVVSSLGMLLVPTIAQEMGVSVATAQWMLTINLLVGVVATPVMGRLSDGPYKKRALFVALAFILIGSVMAALATNFTVFLIGRALQGLTYGIVPATISLARRYVAPEHVRSTISSLSVTVATGLGLGYPLTGILADFLGFRSAFWFAALFIISAAVVVWTTVPDGPDPQAPGGKFDFWGALFLGVGLGSLLLGISEGTTWGWGSVWTIGALALAAVCLTIWSLIEVRSDHPLINLRTLRNGDVLLANGTAIGLGVASYIGLSVASLVVQAPVTTDYGMELPLVWAGFVIAPLSVGSFAANRVVRRVAKRVSTDALLPLGTGVMAAAGVMLWLAHSQLWGLLVGIFLFGVGIGAAYAATPALIARSVAVAELGASVSFNQVLRTAGSSFGTAIAAAIMAAHPGVGENTTDAGITAVFAVGAIVCFTVFAALIVRTMVASPGRGLRA
ncbi:MFS transporter [Gulosibacter molinativorax]|uniref:MFS transporter n=1 Tax=Gulosibacter molinativorax TaxID=256821 RepID=A0ABT7C551_9MICO|nr:MFS transporter [Gulosibacter molinativorax]MDJ1370325.1 MFS transporter [Gulosibacter molinativorax]QUY61236.1 MFS transporter [Gulosibacter molinativorax]